MKIIKNPDRHNLKDKKEIKKVTNSENKINDNTN